MHAKLSDGVLALVVFFLLPDKSAATYIRMFELLAVAVQGLKFQPSDFVVDFEMAIIKAIKTSFPACQIVLCFLHLRQSINRNINMKGLATLYREDADF